jgi:hypothetical protein
MPPRGWPAGAYVPSAQVKESKGRVHWWSAAASWHALSGALCVIVVALMSMGAVRAMPMGCAPAAIAKNGRTHKRAGRVVTLALLAVVASGWYKLFADSPVKLGAMFAGLAALAAAIVLPRRKTPGSKDE